MEKTATERPSDAANCVLDETGYRKGSAERGHRRVRRAPREPRRARGLDHRLRGRGAAAGETATLAGYLERVTLAADVDQMKDAPRAGDDDGARRQGARVRAVFLTGMEDEVFPYKGLAPGEEDELEEERRLAYVAITRARERLFITHTATRMLFGQTRYSRPSRFLAHLPQGDSSKSSTRAAPPRGSSTVESWSRPTRKTAPGNTPMASPRARPEPAPAPGERYVDREAFDDVSPDSEMGEGRPPRLAGPPRALRRRRSPPRRTIHRALRSRLLPRLGREEDPRAGR